MSAHVVIWERGTPSLGPAVVAMGVFDGVHLGHQALIAATSSAAHALQVPSVALTFDRDPDQVVTPDDPSRQLLSLDDKCRFLAAAGADTVLVVPFDTEIASMPPATFISSVMLAACTPRGVHVGRDFRFGHFAEGDVRTLAILGRRAGFGVCPHDLVTADGSPVTSTRIRGLIAASQVEEAALLLGRPHRIEGMVVKGRGQGLPLLGIPTANLLPDHHAALPAEGVYAGMVHHGDSSWPAALSVGLPPTFPEAHHVLEAHLIGFDGELLHDRLTVEFHRFLRPQRAFEDTGVLAEAIRADIAEVSRTT